MLQIGFAETCRRVGVLSRVVCVRVGVCEFAFCWIHVRSNSHATLYANVMGGMCLTGTNDARVNIK